MPVEIRTRTAPAPGGPPGQIDTLFVPAKLPAATTFPDGAVACSSTDDYITAGGARIDDPATYDGLENYFREGGRKAYVAAYETDVADALAKFGQELGGGQVVDWNSDNDTTSWSDLVDWAKANSRYALLDTPLAADTHGELLTAAGLLPSDPVQQEWCALFGPWVEIPPPPGVVGGTVRTVPASSSVAGLIARGDQLGNPNRAPAGRDFPLQYGIGFVGADLTDANAAALRNVGLNPLRMKMDLLVLDGFQTGIEASPDTPFWQANCGRARMYLMWRSVLIGLQYEYKTIDGRGRLARAFSTDLDAMCKELWEVDGLFGETPEDAYHVEVGISVNTVDSIARGEMRAIVEVRLSLHARTVIIELVSVPIVGTVSS